MKSAKKILFSLFMAVTYVQSFAQVFGSDEALMQDIVVGNTTMAYNVPSYQFGLSIPALGQFSQHIYHSGFAFNDLVSSKGEVTFKNTIDQLDDINYLGFSLRQNWLQGGFKVGRIWFRIGVEEQIEARFDYPGNLFKLAWYGNGSPEFLGKRISLDGLGFNFINRRNYLLGGAYKTEDNMWSFGANIRYIDGRSTLQTTASRLGWTTDADTYRWLFDGGMEIKSAGLIESGDVDLDARELINRVSRASGSRGFSVDLGASYSPHEKWTFAMNVSDLGMIRWKHDLMNYTNKDVSVIFEGFDAQELFGADTINTVFEQLLDSIPDLVLPDEDSLQFTTRLSGNYSFIGQFQISEKHFAMLTLSRIAGFGKGFFGANISYRWEPVPRWGLMANAAYSPLYGFATGIGTCVHFGAFTLNAGTSNVLAFAIPQRAQSASFRIGMNFIFGRAEKRYR